MNTSSYDVIVLGLGAMGSAALDHLSRRGASVLGIEQFGIAHALGSSHGGSRIIRQSYFEHPDYVPWLLDAYRLWEDLDNWWDEPIVHLCGGLYMGPRSSPTYAGSLLAARQHHLPHELLTPEQMANHYPHITLAEDEHAFFEARAGWVCPEATIRAQVARAREHGAEVWENTAVTGIDAQPHAVSVTCSDGRQVTAGNLILTPGAWAPGFLAGLHVPLTVERHVMYWFETPGASGAELSGLREHMEQGPVYVHESSVGEQIYGFPATEEGAKVAFFRKPTPADPDALDRTISEEEVAAMRRRLRETLPALAERRLLSAKACMYTSTPDEHFIIGRHPQWRNVLVACGFSGHGFKFTPKVGEVLAHMVETDADSCGVGLFDPLRFSEVRAACTAAGSP